LAGGSEPAVAPAEPNLRLPGDLADGRRQYLVAVMELSTNACRHPVGPGPLDEHAARQRVTGLGDTAASNRAPRRVLARHQAEIGHQLPGIGEATEVADFRYDGDGHYKGDPAH